MCGIAGILNYSGDFSGNLENALKRISDALYSRGPDAEGFWISPSQQLGFAHRRLTIIDLSSEANQPMWLADRYGVIFNGEIYNYRELKRQLEQKGHHFLTQSDTEVLLHLYQEYNIEMLSKLRGMFSFSIWDSVEKKLFLARDRFGIKPLYFSDTGKSLFFASTVKALLSSGCIDKTIDPAGNVGYFLLGHVPGPHTLYKKIKEIPPGCYLLSDEKGNFDIKQYFSLSEEVSFVEKKSDTQLLSDQDLHEAFIDSVRSHLVADVPVGLFLSSGLDSSILAGLISELKYPLKTVTLGFEEYRHTLNDEVPLAESVAHHYRTDHHTVWISKDQVMNGLEKFFLSMDQPTIDGMNTYWVSWAAKQLGLKVALSGLGGDELLGGYSGFKRIPSLVNAVKWARYFPGIRQWMREKLMLIFSEKITAKHASLLEYGFDYAGAYLLYRGLLLPWQLKEVMDPDMAAEGMRELQLLDRIQESFGDIRSKKLRISALEIQWYMRNQLLRDTDWASMSHSLEVRVPFVDDELLRRLLPDLLRGNISKIKIANTLSKKLPESIVRRKKTGFNVPIRQWFNLNSHDWALKVLNEVKGDA